MRPTIVVTNRLHDAVRDRLAQHGTVDMNTSLEPWSRSELEARLAGATAMLGFMTDRVDADLLRTSRNLRIVACALKGFDNYDVEACTRAGVWLSIVPDLLTEPTAELAVGLGLALARNILPGDRTIRTEPFNGWRAQLYGTGLHGSVASVIALGKVGHAIVDRLAGFGCARILAVDPSATRPDVTAVSLDEALATSDYVFVSVPLTPTTRNMIGARQLANAKPGQLIINVGRGSVIDEEAIADALEAGRLGGYAADVFACEDWGLPDRPRTIPARLLARTDTVFTPHLGSAVRNVRLAIEQRAADNILAVLAGSPPPDALNRPTT